MRPRFELSDEGASGSHCRWVGDEAEGEAVIRGSGLAEKCTQRLDTLPVTSSGRRVAKTGESPAGSAGWSEAE